jgi:hypothetical protein
MQAPPMATPGDAPLSNLQGPQGLASSRSQRDSQRGGRGRGRGKGGESNTDRSEFQERHHEGRGGRRGRGGQRGNNSHERSNRTVMNTSDLASQLSKLPNSDRQSAGKMQSAKPEWDNQGVPEDVIEAEVCFICASPVVHNSVAPCNHRTCHICSLRMRALYKTKDCAHCRVRNLQ